MTGNDVAIFDFAGEPDQSVSSGRIKRCPLRDVTSMLVSFGYAAQASVRHMMLERRNESGIRNELRTLGRYLAFAGRRNRAQDRGMRRFASLRSRHPGHSGLKQERTRPKSTKAGCSVRVPASGLLFSCALIEPQLWPLEPLPGE
jgi:hypothetical protein